MNHSYYLELATKVASNSPDPSTQLGAVVAHGDKILGTGFNQPISKYQDWMSEREIKYHYFIHAEQEAILSALATDAPSVKGATLYLSKWLPCSECAKIIVRAGIKEIITTDSSVPPRWKEHINCSLYMFVEAGISLKEIQI